MLPDSTTLLRCHPADQNTSFALFWLPVLSQFLTTRRLHSTPHSRTCCSRHHLWPCHLCPHQHPLCMGHTLLYVIPCREQSLPTKPSTLLWVWSVQIRALVALLAMKVKRKGKWIEREPEKKTPPCCNTARFPQHTGNQASAMSLCSQDFVAHGSQRWLSY